MTGSAVTQRWIEVVIGKLLTDAEIRRRYVAAPRETLRHLMDQGAHLTASEIRALLAIDIRLWDRIASHLHAYSLDANPFSE
jgi:hypothetical protein